MILWDGGDSRWSYKYELLECKILYFVAARIIVGIVYEVTLFKGCKLHNSHSYV